MTITNDSPTTASYSMLNAKPGDTQERCVKVTFTGTLPSTVKFYRSSLPGTTGLDADVTLAIDKGTASDNACTGWTTANSIYAGSLQNMASTYATGYPVTNGAASPTWTNAGPNNVVWFRIRATLSNSTPDADQGKTTGTHSFTWEAQNN